MIAGFSLLALSASELIPRPKPRDNHMIRTMLMENVISFGEILEAADKLSLEEQETLIDILRRRVNENRRTGLLHDVQKARKEFQKGRCKPATPKEIMKEILS